MSTLCSTLGSHTPNDCYDKFGGIPAVAVLLDGWDDIILDPENATQWETAIAAGKARIIKTIKGEVPASAPVEVANPTPCGTVNIKIGDDMTFNLMDNNISAENDAFYQSLNRQKSFNIAFVTCEGELLLVDNNSSASISPRTVPVDNRTLQVYTGTLKWYTPVTDEVYTVYTEPVGIFN